MINAVEFSLESNLCVSQMKQPFSTMPPSESFLKTDSLSSSDPVLSDGSVALAPSLGMSPGKGTTMDIGRRDHDETQDNIRKQQQQTAGEVENS